MALTLSGSTDTGYGVAADTNGVRVNMNGTTVATFGASGSSLALQGASSQTGTGITFPAAQVASSDANTLDDYEEGTWTPTISRDGGLGTVTYTAQVGYYVKVGRVVYIWGTVAWSNISAAGSASNTIGGLPFTGGTSQQNGWINFGASNGVATNPVLAGMVYNQTMYLRKAADILAVSNISEAFQNTGSFAFNGMYNFF